MRNSPSRFDSPIPAPMILCLPHKQPLWPSKMNIRTIPPIANPPHLLLCVFRSIFKSQLQHAFFPTLRPEEVCNINSVSDMHINTLQNQLLIEIHRNNSVKTIEDQHRTCCRVGEGDCRNGFCLVGPVCVVHPKSIQLIRVNVGIRYELMVEEVDVCNGGKLGNGEEGRCGGACKGTSLPEVPSFVEESLLKRHVCLGLKGWSGEMD